MLKADEKKQQIEDNAVVFYEIDRRDVPNHHNHPLYVIAKFRDVEVKGSC